MGSSGAAAENEGREKDEGLGFAGFDCLAVTETNHREKSDVKKKYCLCRSILRWQWIIAWLQIEGSVVAGIDLDPARRLPHDTAEQRSVPEPIESATSARSSTDEPWRDRA